MSAITGPFPHGQSGATAHADDHGPGDNYPTHGRGVASWIFTLDNKRVGLLYMVCVVTFFAFGGFFAVALRTMLWSPHDNDNTAAATASYNLYNNFFTMHGAVMVFLF